ncbi:hypothetical protein IWW55_007363, partial [Coemansia sp. RSA 2706]
MVAAPRMAEDNGLHDLKLGGGKPRLQLAPFCQRRDRGANPSSGRRSARPPMGCVQARPHAWAGANPRFLAWLGPAHFVLPHAGASQASDPVRCVRATGRDRGVARRAARRARA